jgi:hypothetical protein
VNATVLLHVGVVLEFVVLAVLGAHGPGWRVWRCLALHPADAAGEVILHGKRWRKPRAGFARYVVVAIAQTVVVRLSAGAAVVRWHGTCRLPASRAILTMKHGRAVYAIAHVRTRFVILHV